MGTYGYFSWRPNRVTVAFIVINSLILGLSVLSYSRLVGDHTGDITTLPENFQVPSDVLQLVDRSIGNNWSKVMITFVDPPADHFKLKYLTVLRERYRATGFDVVSVVSAENEQRLRGFAESTRSNVPLVVDDAARLHSAFGIGANHPHGGIVVIDKAGRVQFRALSVLREDELRQLAERYAVGDVSYEASADPAPSILREGNVVPLLNIRSITDNEEQVLRSPFSGELTLVVFTAPCASCQLGQFVDGVRRMMELGVISGSVKVLFTDNFDPRMIAGLIDAGKLPREAYVIQNSELLRDAYQTRAAGILAPLVLVVGPDGVIKHSKQLFRN